MFMKINVGIALVKRCLVEWRKFNKEFALPSFFSSVQPRLPLEALSQDFAEHFYIVPSCAPRIQEQPVSPFSQ
jgi:hypothetical protein